MFPYVYTMELEIEENLLEEVSFEIVSLVSGCSGSQEFPIKNSRERDRDQACIFPTATKNQRLQR